MSRIFWPRTISSKELETETVIEDLNGVIRKRFTYFRYLRRGENEARKETVRWTPCEQRGRGRTVRTW